MNELNGIIKTKGNLRGTVNTNVKTKAAVSVGGTLISSNTSKRGIPGTDGFSPSATVTKEGGVATITITDKDGVKVIHMGDIGCELTEEQYAALQGADALMIPVGGFFTIDGKQAAEIAKQLGAKIILPMHYKTEYNSDWPITGPEDFLAEYDPAVICRDAEALRVTEKDMVCQPKVVVFNA